MTRHVLKLVWNRKASNALIVLEILLSFLVLFAVLTLASALIGSLRQPLGFEWRDVWNVRIDKDRGPGQEATAESDSETIAMVMRELASMPQVEAVAASMTPPYSGSSFEGAWNIEGKSIFLTQDRVSDGFADVMRLRLLAGRWFGPQDDGAAYTPIVIDSDLARAVYGSETPVGRRFGEQEMRVVGVVAPYKKSGEFANFGKPVNMLFQRVSLASPEPPSNLVLRLAPGTPASFEEELSERLHQVAPQMNFRVRQLSRMRQLAHRLAVFPLVALATVAAFLISMVVLGLSGVLWQNVTRRTREIGLRRAIGASGAAVRRQVVAEVVMLTTLATIVGLAVIAQLPLLGAFSLVTPSAFGGGMAGALAAIYALTVACGLYPGWLASRVEPAEALHYE